MKNIYTVYDRNNQRVLKNTEENLFDKKVEAKILRDNLNKAHHGKGWELITTTGGARFCVVKSEAHPKKVGGVTK